MDEPRPWTPDDPHLYDLAVELWRGDERVDRVESYVAFRAPQVGVRGLADRGLWPDGGLTAPTDVAEMGDVRMARALGFEALWRPGGRFTRRWLYHCDAAGVRVAGARAGPFELVVDGETRVFTQLADGPHEGGGLVSYDRAALKVDAEAALAANEAR